MTADLLRWINVVLAMVVVIVMLAETWHRWHTMPLRLKRSMPWVIGTYVVIAYGSGELAASDAHVDPGLRVVLMLVDLGGLLSMQLLNLRDNLGFTERHHDSRSGTAH